MYLFKETAKNKGKDLMKKDLCLLAYQSMQEKRKTAAQAAGNQVIASP
jgi:hypothetical protein